MGNYSWETAAPPMLHSCFHFCLHHLEDANNKCNDTTVSELAVGHTWAQFLEPKAGQNMPSIKMALGEATSDEATIKSKLWWNASRADENTDELCEGMVIMTMGRLLCDGGEKKNLCHISSCPQDLKHSNTGMQSQSFPALGYLSCNGSAKNSLKI